MFRNNGISKTQTSFAGTSNVLGSAVNSKTLQSTQSTNRNNIGNEIMFAVLTSNLVEVKRLVNQSNSNDIIDSINNYTALHHAVRIKGNNQIIEYLLSVGANPKLKQNENKDAIDLSIESNYRFLIDKLLNEKELELDKICDKLDAFNYEYAITKRKISVLEEENIYLKNSSTQYIEKIEQLKTENVVLKEKYESSEKAFANLLKKTKKNL